MPVIDDALRTCTHDGGTIDAKLVGGTWRWRCATCDREYGRAPAGKSSVSPQTNGVVP